MKICTKCKETKPVTEFSKDPKGRGKLRSQCKWCCATINAAWYVVNRDKALAREAVYRAAKPEKDRLAKHTRRARKHEAGGKLSPDIIPRLLNLQRGKCVCCGKPLGKNFHLDHIMPLALGGANEDGNIQLLRQRCNNQKHAKHPVDFMQQRGFLL